MSITPEQTARNRAYYLAHKEKMDAQVKAALERRLASGVPREISSFRPKPLTEARKQEIKNSNLGQKYGMTVAEFQVLFGKQEGLCAICRKVFDQGKTTNVDHCHKSGKVRSLLCSSCNSGLGSFKDNPELIQSAAEYLRLHAA